jgi:regulation of enolase protein 1 (concanavalin A-like superfamily)
MNNNRIILWPVIAISLFAFPALSQKVGTTSMQWLKVMPCARATAMGDAYSVLGVGAEAVFWNPSGVALAQNQEFSSTYIVWIFDARQGALSFASPLGSVGGIGIQVQYVDYGVFDETQTGDYLKQLPLPGFTGRQFHPFAYLVGVSYAKSLTDRFSAGISVKYAHESLFDDATVMARTSSDPAWGTLEEVNTFANGLMFDFGMRYNTGFRSIQVAASVQNFGAPVRYAKEAFPVPMEFRFGIAADLMGNNALLVSQEDSRLGVAVDLFQPNDYTQQEHVGIEYEYAGTIALRAGYKFNYDTEGFTAGGGVKQSLGGIGISVDYSYGSLGTYLGNVHRISLGVVLQ